MIDRRRLILSAGAMALAAHARRVVGASTAPWPIPPQHRREPRVVGRFGHGRTDDYAWMRPKDWHAVLRDPTTLDGNIKSAVVAENDYLAAMMAPSVALQAELVARMTSLESVVAAPLELPANGFFYFKRTGPGGEPVYARRPATGGPEQVLLDVGLESRGKAFYSLRWIEPQRSADGGVFGWAADETGSGIFHIRVRDMATGRMLVSDIGNGRGEFALSPDGRHLYWVARDDKGRPAQVLRRDIAAGSDSVIYDEPDSASFFIDLKTLSSGRFVTLRVFNAAMSEVRLIPMASPTATPELMQPRTAGLNYDVDDWGGQLIILTDADGALDFKLMSADPRKPGRSGWRDLVAHRPGRFIAAIHAFDGHLVREERRDANPRLVVMSANGSEREVAFDEAAYTIDVPHGQSWNSQQMLFRYESPRTPPATYRLDLASGRFAAAAGASAPAGWQRDQYEVRRLFARAADGEQVPITCVVRKDMTLDGRAGLLLYGYGSYGINVDARFSPAAIALVDQGWAYAIAHVRGGGEMGTNWWRSVLKQGKKTTFTDFIACAEHLIAQRYTSRRRIIAHGLSAGGLLMGVVYTMRPDLWAGVIAQVPFVDVLNTLDDFETHPLGTSALPIWGDPRVPEDYAYIAGYSPYDNLKAADMPALLATGGVADDRVAFWEPLKFAAKARPLTTTGNPILIKTALTGGHTGASGSAASREQSALFLAFAIWAAERRWGDVPQR